MFKFCVLVQLLLMSGKLSSASKEFSLARFGVTFANNSVIDINLVGEGYQGPQITNSGALECHTDDTTCCRGKDNPNGGGRGEWYYPDETVVPSSDGSQSGFYRTRNHMVVRLNRRAHILSPTGVYTCVVPGAGGVNITRYISIEMINKLTNCNDLPTVSNGEFTYTPPRSVSAGLPGGKRYAGTIATYNCSSGYQLIGSSLRACGADGTWNGTTTSCDLRLPTTTMTITPDGDTTFESSRQSTDPPMTTEESISVNCGPLVAPANGRVDTISGTVFGSTAVYTCNFGYILIGSTTTSCASDGMWTSTTPTCTALTINVTITTSAEPPTLGQSYSLICTVTGADPSLNAVITYQWVKEAETVTQVGGIVSSRLELQSLSLSDAGLYTCVVTVASTVLSEDIKSTSEAFKLIFPALFIQLRVTNVPNCKQYSVTNSLQRIDDIVTTLAQHIARRCVCQFNSTFFSDSQLRCFDASPQIVTFRSQLSETSQTSTTELVSYIEQWIGNSKGVVVEGVFLGFETKCSLVINSLDADECPGESTTQNNNLGGIVGGSLAAFNLFLFTLVAVIVVLLIKLKQQARSRSRRQDENREGIELQDTSKSRSSARPAEDQAYEIVDTPRPVEYEEIDKFQETRGNPVMVEQSHPPKGDYEYSQCPAYAPTT